MYVVRARRKEVVEVEEVVEEEGRRFRGVKE
jgi:hypothetical protein